MRRLVLAAALAAVLADCAGGGQGVYLLERPGLTRHLVEAGRHARGARQALLELLRGPSAGERARGVSTAIPAGTRLRGLGVRADTARVFLRSPRPWRDGVYASAQVVYTLTAVPGIERVVLRVDGRRCCVYDMRGRAWSEPLTRALFAGWQGHPVSRGT